MTDKEKRELKNGVISIFKKFNILDHTATIGSLRDDILRYINSLQEEPVNGDLDEASNNALNNVLNTHEIINVRSCLEMFRFGAEWQEKKDQETIELAEDHAMFAGMVKGKEEAIKKTIDFLNWIIGTGNSTIEEYKKYMNN